MDRKATLLKEIEAFEKTLNPSTKTAKTISAKDAILKELETLTKKVAAMPGIENEITQDKFHQMEELRHGQELTSAPAMLYVVQLKKANVALDKIASELEQKGQKRQAFEIDKIADEIDQEVARLEDK